MKAISIDAPITSPVTPPRRRTQRRTSRPTADPGQQRSHRAAHAESQQHRRRRHGQHHQDPEQDGGRPGHRPGHDGTQALAAGRRNAPDTHQSRRGARAADRQGEQDGLAAPVQQLADGGCLQAQDQHQRHHPHRADVAAPHHLQRPVTVPARAEAVDGVGQAVQVHRAAAQSRARRRRSDRPRAAAGSRPSRATRPKKPPEPEAGPPAAPAASRPSPSGGRSRRSTDPTSDPDHRHRADRESERVESHRPSADGREIGQQGHLAQQQHR